MPKPHLCNKKSYYKKGQMVRHRVTRHLNREVMDKRYGLGIVLREIHREQVLKHLWNTELTKIPGGAYWAEDPDNWNYVEIYWIKMKRKTITRKADIERSLQKVEHVTLPQRKK